MMEYYEEQIRIDNCHSKVVCAVVAVWLTTKYGFNLNSETNMLNETQFLLQF